MNQTPEYVVECCKMCSWSTAAIVYLKLSSAEQLEAIKLLVMGVYGRSVPPHWYIDNLQGAVELTIRFSNPGARS